MSKIYQWKKSQIVYGTKKIKGADVRTFEILDDHFARDKNHLYYKGNLTGLDSVEYQMCGNCYIKDGKGVYYILDTKLKKITADPLTFEYIDGGYAKDKSYYFCHGKRIRVKDKPSFRVLQGGYAADKDYLYCLTKQIKLPIPPGNSELKIIEYPEDELNELAIIGKNVLLQNMHGFQLIPGADPETIRFINRYYLVDDHRFYYEYRSFEKNTGQTVKTVDGEQLALVLDEKVFLNGMHVKDIDGRTFCTLGDYYFDDQYIFNYSDKKKLYKLQPIDKKESGLDDVKISIHELLKILFYIFDNFIPITLLKDEVAAEYHDTCMPAYDLSIEKSTIHVHYENHVVSGTVSAFVFLGSRFWSMSRNRKVAGAIQKRLIYDDRDYHDGYYLIDFIQKAIGEHLVKIAVYFYNNGEKDEALLIAHKIYRDLYFWRERGLELLRICPYEILSQIRLIKRDVSRKTTNLARAKEILTFFGDKDLFKRLNYAKEMFGLVAATGNIGGFYKPVFVPLMDITQKETHEHIREILFECFDLAVTIYFRKLGRNRKKNLDSYKNAYPIVQFLVANHINTDFNHARLWECAMVVGCQQEIEQSSAVLQELIRQDVRAPGMWWTESSYPNYQAWQVDAYLRSGVLQSTESAILIVQQVFQILNSMRFKYNMHAVGDSFSRMQKSLVELCEMHQIDPPFQDLTSKKSLSGYSNLVDTICEAEFIVTGNRRLQYGRYALKDKHIADYNLQLIAEGPSHKVAMNDYIGIDYIVDGQPWGRQVKSQVAVYHPKPIKGETVTVYCNQYTQIGIKSSFYWHFEDEEELQPGKWRIEITFPEIPQLADICFKAAFDLMIE